MKFFYWFFVYFYDIDGFFVLVVEWKDIFFEGGGEDIFFEKGVFLFCYWSEKVVNVVKVSKELMKKF